MKPEGSIHLELSLTQAEIADRIDEIEEMVGAWRSGMKRPAVRRRSTSASARGEGSSSRRAPTSTSRALGVLSDHPPPLTCPRETGAPPTASAPCDVRSCRLHMASARAHGGAAPLGSTECVLTYASTEHTLEEVGQLLGCSREYVRQIEERAMAKIHRASKAHGLAR